MAMKDGYTEFTGTNGLGETITFMGKVGEPTKISSQHTYEYKQPPDGIKVSIDVGWKLFYLLFMALLISWGAAAK